MSGPHWSDRYLTTEHLEKTVEQLKPLADDGEPTAINAAYLRSLIEEVLACRKRHPV